MMMEKKEYQKIEMEEVIFDQEDVILTSNKPEPWEGPEDE